MHELTTLQKVIEALSHMMDAINRATDAELEEIRRTVLKIAADHTLAIGSQDRKEVADHHKFRRAYENIALLIADEIRRRHA